MKITKYATRCWTKAAIEIILAFIILVFGMQAFNQLPGMAFLLDFFWFLYAIFWFGIISLLIVAFANIAKSLLTVEPRLTYNEIDAKLELLGKKLGGDWVLAEPEMAPPPPPPEDILPRKRTVAIVLSFVAALMIASIFIGNMALGLGTSMGGGSTPEETFDMFIQQINEHDFVGAIDYTILRFVMSPDDAADILRGMFDNADDFSITVNSRVVMQESDIPQELKDSMTAIINRIKSDYGVDIEDWCVIEFAFIIDIDGEDPHEVSDTIPLVRIQGSWYLMFPPEEEGGGEVSAILYVFEQFIERMNAHDAQGALDWTVYIFANTTVQSQVIDDFNARWSSGPYYLDIYMKYVKNESEFNASEQGIRDEIIGWLTNDFGLTVEVFCIIYWQGYITDNTGTNTQNDMMPVVLISDTWYLVPTGEEEMKIEVIFSFIDAGSTVQFVVQHITNTSELMLTDVYLTAAYANSTLSFVRRQLSTLNSGFPEKNMTYWDTSDPIRLNAGDYLEFEKSAYQIGSWFELTNADGTKVYCHIDFA